MVRLRQTPQVTTLSFEYFRLYTEMRGRAGGGEQTNVVGPMIRRSLQESQGETLCERCGCTAPVRPGGNCFGMCKDRPDGHFL